VDARLVQRAPPAPTPRHDPIPEGSVTMHQKIIGKPYAGKRIDKRLAFNAEMPNEAVVNAVRQVRWP